MVAFGGGYAGEDLPKHVFPSSLGYLSTDMQTDKRPFVASTEMYRPTPNLDIVSCFEDGLVKDWDVFEQLWEYSYSKALRTVSSEHPVLFCDPSWDTKENREKLCELAFEKFDVPGFYLGRSAVMSAFAAGRSTALVIDSGASSTSVVPVYDGYVVKKAIQKSPIGGDFVTNQVRQYLNHMKVDLTPNSLIQHKEAVESTQPPNFSKKSIVVTPSWKKFSEDRLIHQFKEIVCHVSETTFNERDLKRRPMKNFEFPSGFNTVFSIDRFKLVESLFQPGFVLTPLENHVTIPQLMAASSTQCDPEIQPYMHMNAVLTGANTLLPGFADRVYNELHRISPGGKVKVQAAGGSNERKFGPWIGGSILSSLAAFHQLWISKAQYEETGVGVEKKIH